MDSNSYVIPPLYIELAKTLSGDIDASYQATTTHACDNSPYVITPHIIVFPKDAADIKNILGCADEYRIPVAVQGHRQSTSGAALVEGIAIDTTKYMNHIVHVDPLLNFMITEPGVSCKKIRDHLAKWNMEIPFLTEDEDDSTIGGVIATKNVSSTSHAGGGIQAHVLGMTIMLPNGEQHVLEDGITPSGTLLSIYQQLFPLLSREAHTLRGGKPHCTEDPSGYNIWGQSIGPRQLISHIIGSQGTLAVIVRIKLRITPKKTYKELVRIHIPTYTDLQRCIERARHHAASAISMYDTLMEQLVENYASENTRETKKPLHVLTLLVTLEDNDRNILNERVTRLIQALPVFEDHKGIAPQYFRSELFTQHSHITKLLSSYSKNTLIPVATGNGIIVPLQQIENALQEIEQYHTDNHLIYSVTGSIGSGHIRVTTLIAPDGATFAETVTKTTEALFCIAKKYKGSLSAGSGDGLVGTPYLSRLYSQNIIDIFARIKAIWDPHNILNPGKKSTIREMYVKDRTLPPRY